MEPQPPNLVQAIEYLKRIPKYNPKELYFAPFVNKFITTVQELGVILEVKVAKSIFASLFTGQYLAIHDSVPIEIRTNDEWKPYLDALFEKFHPTASLEMARSEFDEICQTDGESVQLYRFRLERKSYLAFPYSDAERESALLHAFIKGLLPGELRMFVKNKQPSTFVSAFETAELFETNKEYEMKFKSNRAHSRSCSPSGLLFNVSIMMSVIMAMIGSAGANYTFYDCTNTGGGIAVAPLRKIECPLISSNYVTIETPIILHSRNESSPEKEAWKCSIEHYAVCKSAYYFWERPKENRTRLSRGPATEADCKFAFKNRMFRNKPIIPIPNQSGMFQTDPEKFPDNPWWGVNCKEEEKMILEISSIIALENGIIFTPLIYNLNGCTKESSSCSDGTGTVMWESSLDLDDCNIISLNPHQAIIRERTVVIEAFQSVIRLRSYTAHTGPQRRCFPFPIFETTSGAFVSFPATNNTLDLSVLFLQASGNTTQSKSTRRSRRSPDKQWKLPMRFKKISQWNSTEMGEAVVELNVSLNQVKWQLNQYNIEPRHALERAIVAGGFVRLFEKHFNSFSFENLTEFVVAKLGSQYGPHYYNLTESSENKEELKWMAVTIEMEYPPDLSSRSEEMCLMIERELGKVAKRIRDIDDDMQMKAEKIYSQCLDAYLSRGSASSGKSTRESGVIGHERDKKSVRTVLADDLISSVGSSPHVDYMQVKFDQEEKIRRDQVEASQNAKMNYGVHKTLELMRTQFDQVSQEMCKLRQRSLEILWGILPDNPTLAIRAMMRREDVTAEVIGVEGELKVQQCRSIRVVRIADTKQIGNKCFIWIPVYTEQNELYFLKPGTKDLKRSSPEEYCIESNPVIKKNKINGTYSYYNVGEDRIIVKSIEIDPISTVAETEIDFNTSGINRPKMSSGFPRELASSFGSALQDLRKDANSIMSILTKTEYRKNPLDEIVDFSKEKALELQNVLEDAFMSRFKSFLLYALFFALCVAGLIVSLCCLKCYIYKSCMNTALTTFANNVEDDGEAIPLVELKKFMPFDRYVPTRPGAVPSAPPLEAECDALISHIDGSGSVLYVMGAINNFECVSLWDTGANVTLVRHNAAKKAGVAQMYPTTRKGSAANNTRLTFLGEIQANITVGSYTINGLTILVVPEHDSPSDLLFGTNLFEKFQEKGILTNIDYINKKIIVGKDNLKLVKKPPRRNCV